MEVKVKSKFIHASPRKIRLVVDLIRNKPAYFAINQLRFINKASTVPVLHLLKSAISAAKDKDSNEESLFIKEIYCCEGPRLKRRRMIHRGRATSVTKRMSHVTLILSDENISKVSKESKVLKKKPSDSSDTSDITATLQAKGVK